MLNQAAADFIESRATLRSSPLAGGFKGQWAPGAFADTLENQTVICFNDIPGWPLSTAVGHAGKLVVGTIDSLPVAALAGRAHLYEGYTAAAGSLYGIRALSKFGMDSIVSDKMPRAASIRRMGRGNSS